MFLRAYRVCSHKYLDSEIDYIFDIDVKLKYPRQFIEVCLRKSGKKFIKITIIIIIMIK